MDRIIIDGGARLEGSVAVGGAKNAVLKQMMAALLAPGRYHLRNVPGILDVTFMEEVLQRLGAECTLEGTEMEIVVPDRLNPEAPLELVRAMRASVLAMGVLLARCGEARVALPGGDDFGARPIDMHLAGLELLGATSELIHGEMVLRAPNGLRGAEVDLEFPSVGATENTLLASVLAKGRTTIYNAAREPEIVDLAGFLKGMGADVRGAGTATISVEGAESLHPTDHAVIPDRIEAGTYAIAGAITAGTVRVEECRPDHLRMELNKLREAGCKVDAGDDWIQVHGPPRPDPLSFATLPYPGFHTDMHPQMVALLAVAEGTSIMTENLYDARFRYIGELNRMGADINVDGGHAVIRGVDTLSGCEVDACDIRAGAALVTAALRAEGTTTVVSAGHIDRGYEDFVPRLQALGAAVTRA